MKSKGPEASLTILPVRLAGRPFDRVTEVVGMMLEQRGLKNIELGKAAFGPANKTEMDRLAVSFAAFVAKNPITTDYALYAEFNVNSQRKLDELNAIVVDKSGAVVWTDRLTAQDEAFKSAGPRAMEFCILLVERLSPQLSLNQETAKDAATQTRRIMEERSGMPPESQRTPA